MTLKWLGSKWLTDFNGMSISIELIFIFVHLKLPKNWDDLKTTFKQCPLNDLQTTFKQWPWNDLDDLKWPSNNNEWPQNDLQTMTLKWRKTT